MICLFSSYEPETMADHSVSFVWPERYEGEYYCWENHVLVVVIENVAGGDAVQSPNNESDTTIDVETYSTKPENYAGDQLLGVGMTNENWVMMCVSDMKIWWTLVVLLRLVDVDVTQMNCMEFIQKEMVQAAGILLAYQL